MMREKLDLDKDIKSFAEELKRCFSKGEIENIAREIGFVKRKGKIDAWEFVCLCCFMNAEVANNTLVSLCTKLSSKLGISVSNQALDQRLNENCVSFLKRIFENLLKKEIMKNTPLKSVWDKHFKRIRILDSTSFQVSDDYKETYLGYGGSSQTAGVKIQMEYELKSGSLLNIQVGPGATNDNTYGSKIRSTIEEGDLVLRDLGYFNFEDFSAIERRKAFYISRLKSNIAVYMKNEELEYFKNGTPKKSSLFKRIDIAEIMRGLKYGQRYEIKDIYVGMHRKMKTRLILYRLTEAQLKKRSESIAKIDRKKCIKRKAKTIELQGISIYISNIDEAILDSKQIHEFYSLRWQVEIVFKTWKSIFKIHSIKPVKLARFQCQLYGKLILVLISSSVMFRMRSLALKVKGIEASEIKLCEIVFEYIERLYFELISFPENVPKTLHLIFKNAVKNGLKSHRKSSRTVFDILGICCKQTPVKSSLVA